MQGQLKSSKVLVTMADNKSVTQIDSIATLKVQFEHKGVTHTIVEDFAVLDMNKGNQIIIGLPTIIFKLLGMFQEMLEDAVSEICSINEESERARFFNGDLQESPEEQGTPVPSAFDHFLHFTSISKEEAEGNFKSLLEKHVAPHPIQTLLRH